MPTTQRTLDASVLGSFSISTISTETPHTQVAMRFIDTNNDTITPTAGTFTVSVKPDGARVFQPLQLGTDITATDPLFALTYTAIGEEFQYDPTGITGADRIVFTLKSTRA